MTFINYFSLLPKETSEKLFKKFILGMSLSTRFNLLYNPYKRYFIFTVNNKIIVEFLEESRCQLILEDSKDEISVRKIFFLNLIIQKNIFTILLIFSLLLFLQNTNSFQLLQELLIERLMLLFSFMKQKTGH
jgi:hypothetical protein